MQLPMHVVESRVQEEIKNRALMGYVMDGCEEKWRVSQGDRTAMLDLHQYLKQLPLRPEWPFIEPSDLEGIRRARSPRVILPPMYLNNQEIQNKIHGAWLGRVAGCILGKPLEGDWDMAEIQDYLEQANALPLSDYIPAQSRNGKVLRRDCVPSMRGYVSYAQEDDDINYMCLAVKLLENYGPQFTTLDVGMNWLNSIPFLWTWGPEHVVYLNLAQAIGEHTPRDVDLDHITGFLNPGVEYIGAQIRTDVYGYVCPGQPELAAEFAWRDAYLTHRMSGVYGAMWVAAMNASAFVMLDMEKVILAGLAQVPAKSRFHEAICQTIAWVHADQDWRITGRRIAENFDQYSFAGTINNACCIAAALLYGWGDGTSSEAERYERAITIAVQLGYDTDCNSASVGSIVGLMIGANLLPQKWLAPLNDTIRSCVVEFGQVSIADMARRTYELSRIVHAQQVSLAK